MFIMILCMISYVISCREQDCIVVLAPYPRQTNSFIENSIEAGILLGGNGAPYPNNPNPGELFNIKTDFDLTGDGLVWYARPQLCFNCTLCLTGLKPQGDYAQ